LHSKSVVDDLDVLGRLVNRPGQRFASKLGVVETVGVPGGPVPSRGCVLSGHDLVDESRGPALGLPHLALAEGLDRVDEVLRLFCGPLPMTRRARQVSFC